QPVTFLLLGIASILYLSRSWPWSAFLFAALCAICATFSFGFGVAVWAALSVVIFSNGSYRRIAFILVWIGLAVACGMIYNSSWATVAGGASTSLDGMKLSFFSYRGSAAYTLGFQAIRFNSVSSLLVAAIFVLVVLMVTAFNLWILWRRGGEIP